MGRGSEVRLAHEAVEVRLLALVELGQIRRLERRGDFDRDRSLRVRRPQAAPISEQMSATATCTSSVSRRSSDVVVIAPFPAPGAHARMDSLTTLPFCVIEMRHTRPPVNDAA